MEDCVNTEEGSAKLIRTSHATLLFSGFVLLHQPTCSKRLPNCRTRHRQAMSLVCIDRKFLIGGQEGDPPDVGAQTEVSDGPSERPVRGARVSCNNTAWMTSRHFALSSSFFLIAARFALPFQKRMARPPATSLTRIAVATSAMTARARPLRERCCCWRVSFCWRLHVFVCALCRLLDIAGGYY